MKIFAANRCLLQIILSNLPQNFVDTSTGLPPPPDWRVAAGKLEIEREEALKGFRRDQSNSTLLPGTLLIVSRLMYL